MFPRSLFEWSVQAFQKLLAWLSCVVKYEFTVAELGVQSFEFVDALVAEYAGTHTGVMSFCVMGQTRASFNIVKSGQDRIVLTGSTGG